MTPTKPTTDLIERYVHQVGRFVPPSARADIEAELRSQLYDQLEDRYGVEPTPAEIAAMLTELGEPIQIAASYHEERYLIGPAVYPTMMAALRYGWLLIPVMVGFVSGFGALIAPPPSPLNWLIETLWAAAQAVLIFSALVVLFFAIMERSDFANHRFNPLELPEINDPRVVNRFEAAFGVALGTIFLLAWGYFLRVGGLTLRFNLNDPGDVIPFPLPWALLVLLVMIVEIVVNLIALSRNRWNSLLWLIETVAEVIGAIALYFAVYLPLFARFAAANPELAASLARLPEILTVGFALLILVTRGSTQITLWRLGEK